MPGNFDPAKFKTADAQLSARIKAQCGLSFAAVAPTLASAAEASAAAAVKPGKERWPVKTGRDSHAGDVGLAEGGRAPVIVDTTIEELRRLLRPDNMQDVGANNPEFQEKRAVPVELTIWRISGFVTAVKNEADGDLHLALQGESGDTMIAESARPDAVFLGKRNPWLPALKKVRAAIEDKQFMASLASVSLVRSTQGELVPQGSFDSSRLDAAALAAPMSAATALKSGLKFKARISARKARITGVGFFDRVHNQTGVAITNGIELHPIFDFKWLT